MRIVHLSNSTTSGAYSAALKMHNILLKKGYNSIFYARYSRVRHKRDSGIFVQNNVKGIFLNLRDKYLLNFFKNKLNLKRSKPEDIFSFYQFEERCENGINNKLVKGFPVDIDILFVHWISGFVNTFDILNIQKRSGCKVIFTMMDMAPITGGCHYSMGCELFMSNCISCPALPYDKKHIPYIQLKSKAINMLKLNSSLLTFSQKDLFLAKKSHIKFASYQNCILPFEIELFSKTADSRKIKKKEEIHLLGCAYSKNNLRKGTDYFLESLIYLDRTTSISIYVHHVDLDFEQQYEFVNVKFIKFEYSNKIEDLVSLYEKIDILVFTSVADSGPQMIFESLLCGIPVVSFDIGYADQLIINNWNGYIVDIFDSKQLSHRILDIIKMYNNKIIDSKIISNHAMDYYNMNSFESKLDEILEL